MKPFNLEEALSGKPVQLKNSLKAFIIGEINSKELSNLLQIEKGALIGFAENNNLHLLSWDNDGNDLVHTDRSYSITGMYETPKRLINGIEVPEPLTMEDWEDCTCYWYVHLYCSDFVTKSPFYKSSTRDTQLIKTRLHF